jgi:hypothetical protein
MKPPTVAQLKAQRQADNVPAGWYSRNDLEREWNRSRDYTGKLIKEAVDHGRAEMKKFLIFTPSRGLYPTPHYRFK